jgi:hypothetical protein
MFFGRSEYGRVVTDHPRISASVVQHIDRPFKPRPVRGTPVTSESMDPDDPASRHRTHCGFSPEECLDSTLKLHSPSIFLLAAAPVKGMAQVKPAGKDPGN